MACNKNQHLQNTHMGVKKSIDFLLLKFSFEKSIDFLHLKFSSPGSDEFNSFQISNGFHPYINEISGTQTQIEKKRKEKMNRNQQEEKKGGFGFGFGRKKKMAAKQKQQQEEEEKMKKMKEEEMKEMKEEMKKMIKEEMKEEMKKMKEEEEEKMKEEDSVWGNFIPSIYLEIIAKSSPSPSSSTTSTTTLLGGFSSKKELCCSLFDKPMLIDGGSKSFSLEKGSGKICFMLGAKAVSIIWGSNPTYWKWRPYDESRFPEVAELLNVCWMQIIGKVETRMLSPKTMYGAYFVIKTAEKNYGLDKLPGQFSMRFVRGGGECSEARMVFLKRGEMQQQQQGDQFPRERGDGWMEIEMGEFYNNGEEDGEVEMHLLETGGHWKCGLIVQGMELRPK